MISPRDARILESHVRARSRPPRGGRVMTTIEAYADLVKMGKPILMTSEVAARLRVSPTAASMTLKRLANAGLSRRISRGLWTVSSRLDPYVVPEYLTAPFPAYVSLQSALYLHGMI